MFVISLDLKKCAAQLILSSSYEEGVNGLLFTKGQWGNSFPYEWLDNAETTYFMCLCELTECKLI